MGSSGTSGQELSQVGDNSRIGKTIAGLLLFALLLRLIHLASAVDNPFSYHLGPDEDYYLRFGQWIAGLASGDATEFAFMDPAYGYILGLVFKLFGPNEFTVLFIQALVDSVTTVGIFLIGREIGRTRGGIVGAILYALTATAILYTATFLKVSWVANAIVLWTGFSLYLLRCPKAWPWFAYGLFCAYCVALRGNLVLLSVFSFLILPSLYRKHSGQVMQETTRRMVLMMVGMMVPLLWLSVHNEKLSGSFSPLPNNGGTVLHQLYNTGNPEARSWYPDFAPYTHPTEILRGYAREAEKRSGQSLSPTEVDQYWRAQAMDYIRAHPGEVIRNMGRKAFEFTANREVANNRSMPDEQMFSHLLRILPSPFTWLFALGLPGLFVLYRNNRNAVLIITPVVIVLATFVVFFAEARFRFHAVPLFALGAGLFIDDLYGWFKQKQSKNLSLGLIAVVILAGTSAWSGSRLIPAQVSWEGIAWGYIKMGDLDAAEKTLQSVPDGTVNNAKWEEAWAFIAWSRQDFEKAITHYRKAVEINPGSHVAHYNLAMMLARSGQADEALRHAGIAVQIAALPEYEQLIQQLSGE